MAYQPDTIRGLGLEVWIDTKVKPKHPLGWGYQEWLWLHHQGVSLIDLARAMGYKTTGAMKEWTEVHHEESAERI